MDRTHVFFGILLNLFSVQLTFGGNGEFLFGPPPQSYQMRYPGVQPFIQAQFHPASGTIQQGIMIPQEHQMPQERMVPEELYGRMLFQDLMAPQERMVSEERMSHELMQSPHHMIPQEGIEHEMLMVNRRNQDSTASSEQMVPQESAMNEQRMVPQIGISASQISEHQAGSLSPDQSPQHKMMLPQRTVPQSGLAAYDHQERMVPQDVMEPQENIQKILHSPESQSPPKHLEHIIQSDLTKAHNGLQRAEEDLIRAVKGGYEYPTHSQTPYPQAPPYGYSPPNYSAPAAATPSYTPPAVHHEPETKFLKPDLTELIKPVTGKMAGKLNGLLGLVLSLLGSGKGLELTGIKELLFDGILKPILVGKGSLKALISKLAIPVVALILINVEVLITVWWLWEDCPAAAPVKQEVEYTKPTYPAGYNYR